MTRMKENKMPIKVGDKIFKLTHNTNNVFTLWIVEEHYCGHVSGGLSKTWAYIAKGTRDECLAAFEKRKKSIEKRIAKKQKSVAINSLTGGNPPF